MIQMLIQCSMDMFTGRMIIDYTYLCIQVVNQQQHSNNPWTLHCRNSI